MPKSNQLSHRVAKKIVTEITRQRFHFLHSLALIPCEVLKFKPYTPEEHADTPLLKNRCKTHALKNRWSNSHTKDYMVKLTQ